MTPEVKSDWWLIVMNFASRASLPHNRAACMGILRTTLEEKKISGGRKKKREEAFLRRGLNGFTICFGGAGSCIITCLLVHCLSSSVSQLKQPSVCSYFRKRWHTNQAAAAQFICLPVRTAPGIYWPPSQTLRTEPSVKCRLSPAGLQFTKTSHFNKHIHLWKDFNWIIMTSIIVL